MLRLIVMRLLPKLNEFAALVDHVRIMHMGNPRVQQKIDITVVKRKSKEPV